MTAIGQDQMPLAVLIDRSEIHHCRRVGCSVSAFHEYHVAGHFIFIGGVELDILDGVSIEIEVFPEADVVVQLLI